MTKLITRFFDDASQARAVRQELLNRQRFPPGIISFYDKADGLAATLTAAKIQAATAQAYEERMAKGGAVILVRAGYKPLSVAQITRDITASMGAASMAGLIQEVYVKDTTSPLLSVMSDHPLLLSRRKSPDDTSVHMADWPIPLISRRKPFSGSVFPRHARMAAWPFPLTNRHKPFKEMLFEPHARMANWPIPLLSDRKPYTGSMIPKHGRMANFPLPLISRRKPFAGTLIGRHTRMANWPFPHLINGKGSTNALIPGGPRMANFPISLLSNRKPYTGSIFSKHARMANFPIGLLSRRKPMTASIIPRHGRMASWPFPLIIRRSESRQHSGKGFSISRMFGMPTVIRR